MDRNRHGSGRPSILRQDSGEPSVGTKGEGASDPPSREATADMELCPFCGAAVAAEVAARIRPNKGRVLQAARTGGRKLFGRARKETFLQWFAMTGNVELAADKAGVCRQTVAKHRLSDPEFEAAYSQAIQLGVPDLRARLLAYMSGRPKLNVVGELEPPDDRDFDPQLAIQILREQERMMNAGGSGVGRPRKAGRAPRVATNEEVTKALVKRLVTFGIRVAREEDGSEA
jgi:hypothetical protein